MADLRLHKDKGVNPRMMTCASCGEDLGVILLGANEYVDQCNTCGLKHYGGAPFRQGGKRCQRCDGVMFDRKVIEEHEKIPSGLCTKCQATADEIKKTVQEGGVYLVCEKCGATGALDKNTPEAIEAREKLNVQPPNECGIAAPDCPVCCPEKYKNEPAN